MENTEKEKFETLWSDFNTLVKGKLLTTAQKQKLSTPLAKLILTDAAGSWNDEYSVYGRWLHQLSQTNSAKSELVREILLNDMSFTEIDTQCELPTYYNYVIPAAGACLGCVISMYLDYSKLVQAASTIIPAVLLYPAVTTFRKRMNETNKDKCIEEYIVQLEKYKKSVISVLS